MKDTGHSAAPTFGAHNRVKAADILSAAKTGAYDKSWVSGRNEVTRLGYLANGAGPLAYLAVRLYETDILQIWYAAARPCAVRLSVGAYPTATTVRRVNAAAERHDIALRLSRSRGDIVYRNLAARVELAIDASRPAPLWRPRYISANVAYWIAYPGAAFARCDSCCNLWPADILAPSIALAERLDAGGEAPAGDCPRCAAFAYIE